MGNLCGAKAPIQPVEPEQVDPKRVRALLKDRRAAQDAPSSRREKSNRRSSRASASNRRSSTRLPATAPSIPKRNDVRSTDGVSSRRPPTIHYKVSSKESLHTHAGDESPKTTTKDVKQSIQKQSEINELLTTNQGLRDEIERLKTLVAKLEGQGPSEPTSKEASFSTPSLKEGSAEKEESAHHSDASWKEDHPTIVNKSAPVYDERGNRLYGLDAEIASKLAAKRDPKYEKRALKWIEKITGDPIVSVHESLKTGLVLCKLINAFFPDIISEKKIHTKPHPLHERENIQLYISACERVGVSRGDLFNVNDLYEKKDLPAVVQNIYAFADLVAFKRDKLHLPKLTLGNRTASMRVSSTNSGGAKAHAGSIFEHPEKSTTSLQERKATPEWKRRQREREEKSKSFRREVVNRSSDVFDESGTRLYGLDAEVEMKMKRKRDPAYEMRAVQWVSEITKEITPPEDVDQLKTGIALCKLINTFFPGIVPESKVHGKAHPLHERDNLKLYLSACERVGIDRGDLFNVSDLYERKDIPAVIKNIYAFADLVCNMKDKQHLPKLSRTRSPPPKKELATMDVSDDGDGEAVAKDDHQTDPASTTDDDGASLSSLERRLKEKDEEIQSLHEAAKLQKSQMSAREDAVDAMEKEFHAKVKQWESERAQHEEASRSQQKEVSKAMEEEKAKMESERARQASALDARKCELDEREDRLKAMEEEMAEKKRQLDDSLSESKRAASMATQTQHDEELHNTIQTLSNTVASMVEEQERSRLHWLLNPNSNGTDIDRFVARFRVVQLQTHFPKHGKLHSMPILDVLPAVFRSVDSDADISGKCFVLSSCICLWGLAYGQPVRIVIHFREDAESVKRDHGSDCIFITLKNGKEIMLHSLPCTSSGYTLLKDRFKMLNPTLTFEVSSEYTESWSEGDEEDMMQHEGEQYRDYQSETSSSEGFYEDAEVYSEEDDDGEQGLAMLE